MSYESTCEHAVNASRLAEGHVERLTAEVVRRSEQQHDAVIRRDEAIRRAERVRNNDPAADSSSGDPSLRNMGMLKEELAAALNGNESIKAKSIANMNEWEALEQINDDRTADLRAQVLIASTKLNDAHDARAKADQRAAARSSSDFVPREVVVNELNAGKEEDRAIEGGSAASRQNQHGRVEGRRKAM